TTNYRYDLLGRQTEMIGPPGDSSDAVARGVSRYTMRELRKNPDASNPTYPGPYYLVRADLPHKLRLSTGSAESPFDGPVTLTWLDAGGKMLHQAGFAVDESATTYDPRNRTYATGIELSRSQMIRDIAGMVKTEKTWYSLAEF